VSGISRRRLFEAAGVAASGAALGAFGRDLAGDAPGECASAVPFLGTHQAGVTTAPQSHLAFAAFDVTAADATALRGKIPTYDEAVRLIKDVGGTILRVEEHAPGGRSTHTYPHINYTTADGLKATVQIQALP
jgi:hypothetical protein